MAFITTRFPTNIAYGWGGGPEYSVTKLTLDGGAVKRNGNWTYPRHSYDLIMGLQHITDMEEFITFFHVCNGPLHTFPFKDHGDYKSVGVKSTPAFTDHIIGTGDGTAGQTFQIIKIYTVGSDTQSRKIRLPVNGTLLVGWNGVQKTESVDWTCDYTTGIITATVPNTETITAGYEFNVPCIFDTNQISTSWEEYEAGRARAPIIEDTGY